MRLRHLTLMCALLLTVCVVGCSDGRRDTAAPSSTPAKYGSGTKADGRIPPGLEQRATLSEATEHAGFDPGFNGRAIADDAKLWSGRVDSVEATGPAVVLLERANGDQIRAVKEAGGSPRSFDQWVSQVTESRGEYSIVSRGPRRYVLLAPCEPPMYQGEDGMWHHRPGVTRKEALVLWFNDGAQTSYLASRPGANARPEDLVDWLDAVTMRR